MNQKYLVGIIFIAYSAVSILKPGWIIKYQVWVSKKLLGAKFVPSKKTETFYRNFGIFFAGMGLLVIVLG